MNYRIYPPARQSRVSVKLPLSKSESNRALLIRALTDAPLPEMTSAQCDDTRAMLAALKKTEGEVNVGAAGTAMRFMTAYYASTPGTDIVIDGTSRMRKRPIAPLVDALRVLGADIEYLGEDGFPPMRIRGKRLKGGNVDIEASISSQFLSALMMVGPTMAAPLKINLTGTTISMPYIVMTVFMMMRAGVQVLLSDNCILISQGKYRPVEFNIDGDWSACSYWYELMAINAFQTVTVSPLSRNTIQGDSELQRIFSRFGVNTTFLDDERAVYLSHSYERTKYFVADLSSQPDLAQTIAVTCCLKYIPFKLRGLSTLPNKETDRLLALKTELNKLGFNVQVFRNEELAWDGSLSEVLPDTQIETYNDHRMAMSFAPAAVIMPGIIIKNAEVVSKSYPGFWKDLQSVGFKIEAVEE